MDKEQVEKLKHIKFYDLEIQADGSVKVVTELSPEDMKILLEFAFIQMMAYGFTLPSLLHYFPSTEEQQKALLQAVDKDTLAKA